MKRVDLNPGTLLAPLPAVMVSVGDMENSNIITVAWTGILSSDPARAYISVRPSRHSHGLLRENGEFVINLTTEALAKKTDYVGIYTGKKVDKFEKCSLTKQRSEKVAPPTIAECPIALECRVCDILSMGSHDVFIADIVSVSCKEELIDGQGKLHFEKADLLAYAHGEYCTLGQVIGRFGFSTDKTGKTEEKKSEKRPFYEDLPKRGSAKKSTVAAKRKKK
jgi:flavin reductase (DIM6/NTAB) family NADH-FMN oxidoreductase RutF